MQEKLQQLRLGKEQTEDLLKGREQEKLQMELKKLQRWSSNPLCGGILVAKSFADDRKAAAAKAAKAKKFIIKSADMGEDVQKEAIDVAIAIQRWVCPPNY
ncbi:uncharacterized protein LOC130774976 isoform X2 [Actinidia eriantha]|uniref:uncharacterized protein LOC130774976 isoform X2 n=1 Tax=Actinidia eriantha TaxID=165200 RepID=UPI002587030E|nr:uncharacterized protein LOC130774976 isoform X2 [Actinidia eriantha]